MRFSYPAPAMLATLDLVDFAVTAELIGLVFPYSGDDVDDVGELNGDPESWCRRLSLRLPSHLPPTSQAPESAAPTVILLLLRRTANCFFQHDGL